MFIQIKKECKFSIDGINILTFKEGQNIEHPSKKLLDVLGDNFELSKTSTEETPAPWDKDVLDASGNVIK